MNLEGIFMENITYDYFGNEVHVGDTLIRAEVQSITIEK